RDVECSDVLLEVLASLRARDRHEVLPLRQHPRQRQLARRTAPLPRDLFHPLHEVQVLLEVLALETGIVAAVLVGRQVCELLKAARQEAPPQWAVRAEPDAPRR